MTTAPGLAPRNSSAFDEETGLTADPRLECYSKTRRDVVRQVVGAEKFAVVVGVGADAIVPMNGKARTDQHAVATDFRTR